jgi:hypothetical protein
MKNPAGFFILINFCVLLVRREAYIDPAGERPAWKICYSIQSIRDAYCGNKIRKVRDERLTKP